MAKLTRTIDFLHRRFHTTWKLEEMNRILEMMFIELRRIESTGDARETDRANAIIERIVAQLDIVTLISDRLPLEENGNKFKSICPFHINSEDFYTLLIDPDKQTYSCLKCGAHGGPEEFYEKYEGKKLS